MDLRLFLVLFSLIFSDSSLGADWLLHTETDEMEGTSETFPIYTHQSASLRVRVEFTCSSKIANKEKPYRMVQDTISITISTFGGTEMRTAFNQWEQRWGVPFRVDWGDGVIESWELWQSKYYANQFKFALGSFDLEEQKPTTERINPDRFKLELVASNGEKTIVRGGSTFARYVNACKEDFERKKTEVERMKKQDDQRRREEELKQTEAGPSPSARAAYMFAIHQKISRNWSRPRSAAAEIECEVNIQQESDGGVASVSIGVCNGDEAVKRSIEAAVLRASPLPQPADHRLFDQHLRITFRPSE